VPSRVSQGTEETNGEDAEQEGVLAAHGLPAKDQGGEEHTIDQEERVLEVPPEFRTRGREDQGKKKSVADDGEERPDRRRQEALAAEVNANRGDEDTDLGIRTVGINRKTDCKYEGKAEADGSVQEPEPAVLRLIVSGAGSGHMCVSRVAPFSTVSGV
jgi:hypothetical protein